MTANLGDSQLNRLPRVLANIPDAFEMEATDQKSIMMSLRRFDRNGAKDYDIQMDQTAKLTAATHTWNFFHSASKYGPDGCKEEFTFELQQDDSMKQSFAWFLKVNASLIFLSQGQGGSLLEKNVCDFVFRPERCTMTIDIPRKEFEKFSHLENDKEEKITVIVGLAVVSSIGFRNRSRITYDFSTITENSDLKLAFSEKEFIYIDSGYISHLSSYFVGLRRRLSELPKDDSGLPFETFSDINREKFVTLLRIVYPSKEKIDDENVHFLLPLADRFLFEGLLGDIEKFLINSEIDVVLKLEYASMYQMSELQSHLFSKLSSLPNLLKLKDSPYYSNLSADVMAFLFKKLIDNDFEILNKKSENLADIEVDRHFMFSRGFGPEPRHQNPQNMYLGRFQQRRAMLFPNSPTNDNRDQVGNLNNENQRANQQRIREVDRVRVIERLRHDLRQQFEIMNGQVEQMPDYDNRRLPKF